MTIQQLSIFAENRPGGLTEVTELLSRHGINIRALSLADTTDYGILRLIVSAPDEALAALKAAGHTVQMTDVLAVAIPDTPGGLAGALTALAAANIGVGYMYAFHNPAKDAAYVILRVDDNANAENALRGGEYRIMSHEEICQA